MDGKSSTPEAGIHFFGGAAFGLILGFTFSRKPRVEKPVRN
jgi:hypothetical protein